ncbi:hypothetical protein DBV15_03987 [Temnothorax longispinosus]|uniref:Uncharacterized protein n=1 Tax=Temnothorax longispinosus TaxID=300112 RepID=A0A4S2LB08_9HYME|nr:hypothetical protein DBV15_03987 [Temnothorax longispinosus]
MIAVQAQSQFISTRGVYRIHICRRTISLEFPGVCIFIAVSLDSFQHLFVIASAVDRFGVRFATLRKAVVWSNKTRDSRLARVVTRNNLVSVRNDNLRVGWVRVFYSQNVSPFRSAKVLLSAMRLLRNEALSPGALFETIIALGWTRSDYWRTGQFHFARIIARNVDVFSCA